MTLIHSLWATLAQLCQDLLFSLKICERKAIPSPMAFLLAISAIIYSICLGNSKSFAFLKRILIRSLRSLGGRRVGSCKSRNLVRFAIKLGYDWLNLFNLVVSNRTNFRELIVSQIIVGLLCKSQLFKFEIDFVDQILFLHYFGNLCLTNQKEETQVKLRERRTLLIKPLVFRLCLPFLIPV